MKSLAKVAQVTASATVEHGATTNRVRVQNRKAALARWDGQLASGPKLSERRGKRKEIFRKSGAGRDYRVYNQGSIQVCISMPAEDFAKLSDLVRHERKNRSQVVRDLILERHVAIHWKKK